MVEIMQDLSPSRLIEAIESNMFDFWTYLGRSPRVELYDGSDMIRFICDVPSPFCNNVLRAQLSTGDTDTIIEETLTHFKSRNLPIRWWTSPSTRPADLGKHLKAHKLTHMGDFPGMAIYLPELREDLITSSDLTIEHVDDLKTLGQMIKALTIGYGIPISVGNFFFDILSSLGFELPLRHYIGRFKGEPVACSSLFLSSGVAGIYFVATVPEARGQGIGSALTMVPLREACVLGYRIGILGSTRMGLGVYQRLGFREYLRFGMYLHSSEMIRSEYNVSSV